MDIDTIMAVICPFIAAICALLIGRIWGEHRAYRRIAREQMVARTRWYVWRFHCEDEHPTTLAREAFQRWLANQN